MESLSEVVSTPSLSISDDRTLTDDRNGTVPHRRSASSSGPSLSAAPNANCTLADCRLGDEGVVVSVDSTDSILRNKLLTMGVIRDTVLRVTQVAPLGDPISILVRGFTLSLRRSEARCISFVRSIRPS